MQQIVNHSVTKSFCFFAAGATLLAVQTRDIAAVRGLIRRSPAAGAALILGGLAIAGAPPLAVFLSEFAILKAGLLQGQYVATALLAAFIVDRVLRRDAASEPNGVRRRERERRRKSARIRTPRDSRLPFSCTAVALVLAAVPVLVLGVYVPEPLHKLLAMAAAALTR